MKNTYKIDINIKIENNLNNSVYITIYNDGT